MDYVGKLRKWNTASAWRCVRTEALDLDYPSCKHTIKLAAKSIHITFKLAQQRNYMRCLGFAAAGRPESLRVLAASSAPPASRLGPLQQRLTVLPWHMNTAAASLAASASTTASPVAGTPAAPRVAAPLTMRTTHVARAASSSTPTTPSSSSPGQQQQQEEESGIRFVYEPPRRFILGALRQRRMGPPSLARPRVDLLVEGKPLGTLP